MFSQNFFLWIKTRWQSLRCHWPKNVYPRKNTSIDWPWFLLHTIKNVCLFLRCIQWCAFETIKIFKTTTANKNWKYMMCALCNYLCICSSHSWLKMLLKNNNFGCFYKCFGNQWDVNQSEEAWFLKLFHFQFACLLMLLPFSITLFLHF